MECVAFIVMVGLIYIVAIVCQLFQNLAEIKARAATHHREGEEL